MSGEIQWFVALFYFDYHCIFQGPSRWIRAHVILETEIKLGVSINNTCLSLSHRLHENENLKPSADSANLASP